MKELRELNFSTHNGDYICKREGTRLEKKAASKHGTLGKERDGRGI